MKQELIIDKLNTESKKKEKGEGKKKIYYLILERDLKYIAKGITNTNFDQRFSIGNRHDSQRNVQGQ